MGVCSFFSPCFKPRTGPQASTRSYGEGTLGNEPCFLASKQTPASPEAVYATPDVNSAFGHHKTDDLAGAAKALEAEFQQATLSVAKAVIRPSSAGPSPRPPVGSPKQHPCSARNRASATTPSKNLDTHRASVLEVEFLTTNDKMLRALLSKARSLAGGDSVPASAGASPSGGMQIAHEQLADAELRELSKACISLCSAHARSGPLDLEQLRDALDSMQRWLALNTSPHAATAVLYTAGEALVRAEHRLRSMGQVRFWPPEAITALGSLLALLGELAARSLRPATGLCQAATALAVAHLLLRPALLDLLSEGLAYAHFNERFRSSSAGSARDLTKQQEALSVALTLWDFLGLLLRYAAVHASSIGRMEACQARLAGILLPPHGVLPRLLAQPLAADTFALQLNAMRLLQMLFDFKDSAVLHQAAIADWYVSHHHKQAAKLSLVAAADPHCAAAELARMHAGLLRAMARHPGPAVRIAMQRQGVVTWLLGQMSLESELLSTQVAAEEAAVHGCSDNDELHSGSGSESDPDGSGHAVPGHARRSDSDTDMVDAGRQRSVSPSCSPTSARARSAVKAAAAGADGDQKSNNDFKYCWDLNEDVERLLELEERLGKEVSLNGFEFDEEGQQILAQNKQREADAEQQAALGQTHGSEDSAADPSSTSARSFVDPSASSQKVAIPKLSLSSLRTASVSSVPASKVGTPAWGTSSRFSSVAPGGVGVTVGVGGGGGSILTSAAVAAANGGGSGEVSVSVRMSGSGTGGCSTPSSASHIQLQSQSTAMAPPTSSRTTVAVGLLSPPPVAARELTTSSTVQMGASGQLSMLSPSTSARCPLGQSGFGAGPGWPQHGRVPILSLPMSRLGVSGNGMAGQPAAQIGQAAGPNATHSLSHEGHSSRTLVMLSATNRSGSSAWPGSEAQVSAGGAPVAHEHGGSMQQLGLPLLGTGSEACEPTSAKPAVPALDLGTLRRNGGNGTSSHHTPASSPTPLPLDTGNTMKDSAYDSRGSPPTTASASRGIMQSPGVVPQAKGLSVSTGQGQTVLQPRLPRQYPQEAGEKLLYNDLSFHLLLLKSLLDQLILPSGALDQAYAVQFPLDVGLPNVEHILLWHFNSQANAGVVQAVLVDAQAKLSAMVQIQPPLLPNIPRAPTSAGRPQPPRKQLAAVAWPSGSSSPRHSVTGDSSQQGPMVKLPPATAASGGISGRAFSPPQSTWCPSGAAAAGSGIALSLGAGVPSTSVAGTRAAGRVRLLRLLCRQLFDASRYTDLVFQARGAHGGIYRAKCSSLHSPSSALMPFHGCGGSASVPMAAGGGAVHVMVKTIDLPGSLYDSCVLQDVFSEVTILERFQGRPGICQLIDYGMYNDAYWIVMRRYRCSLAEWRTRQRAGPDNAAASRLYLTILAQVLEPMKLLAAENVVHFDLKCANILVDPLPGVKDSELWNPLAPKFIPLLPNPPLAATSAASQDVLFESALAKGPQTADGVGATPPFGVVLADFGEARAYRSAAEAFTARNRGTEVFKSPEMLMLNMPAGRDGSASLISCSTTLPSTPPPGCPLAGLAHVNVNANAGSPVAVALSRAGIASDVWSFGCLAYELLSGNVLFGADYASVTHRVAFGGGDNLALLVSERAALGGQAVLIELVEWILARDPAKRPKPDAISERIQAAINVLQ